VAQERKQMMKHADQRAILARGRRKRVELGLLNRGRAAKQNEGKPRITAEMAEKSVSENTENPKEGKKKRTKKKDESNK
jgi:hypothetical protein